MRRPSATAVLATMLVTGAASPAWAQSLANLLEGRWTTQAGGACQSGMALVLTGDELRLTDPAGHADTQQVTERRPTGLATVTTASTHGEKPGTVWVYELLGPGQLSLTQGATGRSADLFRCHPPIPANAGPEQVLHEIYTRYAAGDEPNLPLSSEASLHAFFDEALAEKVIGFSGYSGKLPDDCRPDDPFIPKFSDDRIGDVHVQGNGPVIGDHAAVQVSFTDGGKAYKVGFALDRTSAGWRIEDVTSPSGKSFRADIAACPTAHR